MAKIIKPTTNQADIIRQNLRLEVERKRHKAQKRADAQWKRSQAADTWSVLADLGGQLEHSTLDYSFGNLSQKFPSYQDHEMIS